MPTPPRVSVVLTTYNRGALLSDTLNSICDQTYGDFELVVADDRSTDNTAEIIADYRSRDPRVRLVTQPTNLGMPRNLNAGIQASRGELIANIHDGDIYDHDLLTEWVAALDRCPSAAFVFNACAELDPEGRVRAIFREDLPPCFPGSKLLEKVFYRRWRFGSPVWGTVMARRSAYEAVGPFDERFGFTSDVDMWLRLAERFSVAYVPRVLISLPSRQVLPSSFAGDEHAQARTVERMFLESRKRYFADRPLRRAIEIGRHYAYVALRRAYDAILGFRRALQA